MSRRLGAGWKAAALSLLLSARAAPLIACPFVPNVVVGYGEVGAHQYSQGQGHAVLAATQPLWCVTDQWSLLGAGVAVRAGRAAVKDFDDFGVAIPFATYRRGRFVAQVGSEIQTLRYKKTFFYLALGVTLRRWPVRAAASP